MADDAGPSGSGTGKVAPEVLAEAAAKFERGIQCIRTNDLEAAVQLFAEVLQVRAEHYGDLAPECASAYYRYGSSLLYQAQDSGDVFGTAVKDADDEEEEAEQAEEAAADKEIGGKGKAPAAAAAAEGKDEEEDDESAGEGGDLQLAWEHLESAKVIWQRDGTDKNRQELADVHSLLADVAMETATFPTALAELDAALGYLQKFVQEDDRRIAEVQYRRCCALQFLGEVEAALPAVQAACACLAKRRETLLKKLVAPGEGDEPEKLRAESEDVAALLDDLKEKVTELEDLIAQNTDTKNMLKSTLSQLMGRVGGGAPAAAAGAAEEGGAAAAGAAPAAPGVKNLGVVGRGTKRINLQPVQTNVAAPASGTAAAAGEPAAKKKRSLEALMGGGSEGGETTIGFGSSAPAAAPAAPAAEAKAAAAPEAAGPPPVPAFLQPASVAAVYGSTPEQQK